MKQAKTYLMSLGYLATHFQRSPAELERLLDELDISPAVSINGVHHFDEDAYCVVADRIDQQNAQKKEIRAQ